MVEKLIVVERTQLEELSPLDRFWHDLPELLQTKFGKWVVYTSQGVCMEGDDEVALYERCRRNNCQPGTYVVAQVLPDQPVATVPDEWLGV